MNLKKVISGEHSKKQTNAIIKYVGDDKKHFNELLKLFLSSDPVLSQWAGWPLSYVAAEHPELITPHIGKLIKNLSKKNLHPAVLRNTIRIFWQIDIPEKYCSSVYDVCLRYLQNTTLPHAIRVFSMYSLANICKKHPELSHEFELIISELRSFPQPASIIAAIKKTNTILLKLQLHPKVK